MHHLDRLVGKPYDTVELLHDLRSARGKSLLDPLEVHLQCSEDLPQLVVNLPRHHLPLFLSRVQHMNGEISKFPSGIFEFLLRLFLSGEIEEERQCGGAV